MKLSRIYSVSLLVMFGFFMFVSSSLAVCTEGLDCPGDTSAPSAITISNPLNGIDTPQALIGKVINSVLGVVGSLALVMFVYGGLIWMTSSGSSEQVKKGRDILIWAAIGLVIIFSAYGLVRFVIVGVGA